MTRSLGAALPAALRAVLDVGDVAAGEGLTFLLLTTGDDGWPHVAMVSVGEVVAIDARTLRLALWPTSAATRNLTAQEKAMIAAVVDGTGYTIRVTARRLSDLTTTRAGTLACFEALVEDVGADVAPYAVLESGVRFRLTDPAMVLPRWEETRAALRTRVHDPTRPA